MVWKIEFAKDVDKTFKKLDKHSTLQILKYLKEVAKMDNPRLKGKALSGDLSGLWRYRVEKFRIICKIQDDVVTIATIKIGHRKDVYE
jgi:mRNA interferase RelE/StbE